MKNAEKKECMPDINFEAYRDGEYRYDAKRYLFIVGMIALKVYILYSALDYMKMIEFYTGYTSEIFYWNYFAVAMILLAVALLFFGFPSRKIKDYCDYTNGGKFATLSILWMVLSTLFIFYLFQPTNKDIGVKRYGEIKKIVKLHPQSKSLVEDFSCDNKIDLGEYTRLLEFISKIDFVEEEKIKMLEEEKIKKTKMLEDLIK